MPRQSFKAVKLRVGRRVAELRAERGLTQAALAERMGVNEKYLQRVEAGGQNLTLESLVKLGNALRVEIGDLLGEPASTSLAKPGRPSKAAERQ